MYLCLAGYKFSKMPKFLLSKREKGIADTIFKIGSLVRHEEAKETKVELQA